MAAPAQAGLGPPAEQTLRVNARPVPARLRFRLACTLALTLAAAAAAPSPALAHAELDHANPTPGARVRSPPARVTTVFTEPLNRQLSTAALFSTRSRHRVDAAVRFGAPNELVLSPTRRLPVGAYVVRWHTVSILDGHALNGSFGFGVRVAALARAKSLQQGPLARAGWARAALSAVWYAALFFFGGGLLGAVALRSRPRPASWLLAGEGRDAVTPGADPEIVLRQIWRRTRAAGWLAVTAGVGVVLAETADAAGSLSGHAIHAYLFSTVPGAARVAAVALVALAALLAGRARRIAAVALMAALFALALGGHANSASPRTLALLSNWLHVTAGVIWIGGSAQIVATWGAAIRGLSFPQRRRVMIEVLRRFGKIALPAAVTAVTAGLLDAFLELGSVSQLWHSGYGRVLMVKTAVVGLLLIASYVHAFRLRPRLIRLSLGSEAVERHHWRLLLGQPPLAVVVLGTAALLALFAPPQGLPTSAGAAPRDVAATALQRPSASQVAVAEEAGPWIAAAWVNPVSASAKGTVRLLDYKIHPVPAMMEIPGARTHRCGPGCLTFTLTPAARSLRLIARLGGKSFSALIPIGWRSAGNAQARRILNQAVAALSQLRSWQIAERLNTGLGGPPATSHYWIGARYRYRVAYHSATYGETIGIGSCTWVLQPNHRWRRSSAPPLDTRALMPWWTHRVGVRLLAFARAKGRPVADIALADIHRSSSVLPFWFRVRIDLRSKLPMSMRMITAAHFMDQSYFGFNLPTLVLPPR